MPDTNTPNLNLVKPEIAGSDDTWGDKTNENWDKVDQLVATKTAVALKADKTYVDSQDAAQNTAIAGKAAIVHTHPISQVDNLQAALDGKAASVHTHTTAQVTGLDTALAGKAPISHTHAIADVTGLQGALDGKQPAGSYAAASHTHTTAQVTGLDTALAGKVAKTGDTMTGNLEIQHATPYLRIHKPGVVSWDYKVGAGSEVGVINNSGIWGWYFDGAAFYSPGNVVAYWSDARLKEAIADLDGYEARIMGLRPVSFQWNEKGRERTGKVEGQREIGFIAQEARAVCSQFVAENPTAPDEDGGHYLTVQKDQMIADLVAMVQSLTKRVRELEARG
jgi:hypothetical protein